MNQLVVLKVLKLPIFNSWDILTVLIYDSSPLPQIIKSIFSFLIIYFTLFVLLKSIFMASFE
jgi:hypothetical protein